MRPSLRIWRIECTSDACSCDRAAWYRNYALERSGDSSVPGCSDARIDCPPQTEPFSDECGCGCELVAVDCPAALVTCSSCDASTRERCVYSAPHLKSCLFVDRAVYESGERVPFLEHCGAGCSCTDGAIDCPAIACD